MKNLNRLSRVICLLALAASGFIVLSGQGLGDGSFGPAASGFIVLSGQGLGDGSFGPAAYYYTDLPDWQNRFYSSANLSVQNPQSFLWPALILSALLGGLLLFCLLKSERRKK